MICTSLCLSYKDHLGFSCEYVICYIQYCAVAFVLVVFL